MDRRAARGLSLLDVLVAVAVLALLVWLVHFDWAPRPEREAPPSTAAATS